MKIATAALLLVGAAFAATLLAVPADTPQQSNGDHPDHLLEYLSVGTVLDFSHSNSGSGQYDVVLVSDEALKRFTARVQELEHELAQSSELENVDRASQRQEVRRIRRELQSLSPLWEVTGAGEDYIRLRMVSGIAGWEKVSWRAISKSSIRSVTKK